VAERLVTDSSGANPLVSAWPNERASPNADTRPAVSTIQYPSPEGVDSMSTISAPEKGASPRCSAPPKATTWPREVTIR
jgi:hypothetical protein